MSGRPLAEFLLDERLADPMVRMCMANGGVTEQMRGVYSRRPPDHEVPR